MFANLAPRFQLLAEEILQRKGMCVVLESVFSRISRDILLLYDIAADETLQLQRLIHLMLESLSSLFESLSTGDPNLPSANQ